MNRLPIAALIAAAGLLAPSALAQHADHGDSHAQPAHDSHAAPKPAAKPAAKSAPKPATKPAAKAPAPAPANDDHATADEHAQPEPKPSKPAPKPSTKASSQTDAAPDADTALAWLQEGNERWVANRTDAPNTEPGRREDLAAAGQHPFVSVLTCADSRLPVERIFDRGVGDVFVVRVAGNVAGDSETGTIEYGVGHLNTPLLVVMGHTKCGAVAAAASGAQLHGKVAGLVDHITPAVDRARKNNPSADEATIAQLAITENVWQTMYDLYKNSPEILDKVSSGELKVVGAVCDIATGKVEWLGEHPWQAELITALKVAPSTTGRDTATTKASDDEH